jgi:predicted alpha-1,2-mannosidase
VNTSAQIFSKNFYFASPMLRITLVLIVFGAFTQSVWCQTPAPTETYTQWVDPFIGTDAHGHTHPAAMRPFGMVQLGPDTRPDPNDWDGASGYHYSDSMMYGFSHTHLSGTGVSDLCDLLFMPFCGAKSHDPKEYRSYFDKKNEKAAPGYYAVTLDKDRIQCELTATDRVGVHRYTYPKHRERASLLIDLRHRDVITDAHLRVVNDHELEGYRRSSSWAHDQLFFFVVRFSKRFYNSNCLDLTQRPAVSERSIRSKAVVGYFDFYHEGEPLIITVGISSTSIEGARRNLDAECPDFDFDKVRNNANLDWELELSKIKVTTPDVAQKRTFYTALYHTMSAPNLWSDVDGQYRGRDNTVHPNPGHDVYHVFSLWDTYRACFPLQALLWPDRAQAMIRTFQRQYEFREVLPVWELAANETDCMIGNHSLPVILEGWQHGLIDRPLRDTLLEAMRKTITRPHRELNWFHNWGYVPADAAPESVSKTLEYAFDDWCLYEMYQQSKGLVHPAWQQQSTSYKHLFDSKSRFFRPKSNATWHTPFDPREVNYHYTEANAWQYRFAVQHDIAGMMTLLGGDQKMSEALDSMFTMSSVMTGRKQSDITGMIGQYAHGNEPCHHIAYLYNYVGQPQKTRQRVRQILTTLYSDRPDGLCGNDDCGQMSAWYVWSAIGMYPVTPGSGYYDLGQPLFERVEINLDNGNSFIINNKLPSNTSSIRYNLNGKPAQMQGKLVLSLSDIKDGGTLDLMEGGQPYYDSVPSIRPLDPNDILGALAVPYVAEGVRVFEGSQRIVLEHMDPKVTIYYTLDESTPDSTSRRYEGPFVIDRTCTLKLMARKNGLRSPVDVAHFNAKKALPRVLRYGTDYSPQYTALGHDGLTDQLAGGRDYRSGGWQGYEGVSLDVTLDLGKKVRIETVWANFLEDQKSWIFFPTEMQVEVSADGKKFTPVGKTEPAPHTSPQPNYMQKRFEVPINYNKKIRYVRIVGVNQGDCPDWHIGRYNPAWIFVDEVGVE